MQPPHRPIPVAVLGATGLVGQHLLRRLVDHPWFEPAALFASPRSAGRAYGEVTPWSLSTPLPSALAGLPVVAATPGTVAALPSSGVHLALSALDASVAGPIESAAARAGLLVVSNAAPHRLDPDVPLLIPEVNPGHLELLATQGHAGSILTNPNCSTVALALALAPLVAGFGLERADVVSLQACSGAGLRDGRPLEIGDDVVPHIEGEEQKLATETPKILGQLMHSSGRSLVQPLDLPIDATCTRVPVTDGHLLCVSVRLGRAASAPELIAAWRGFQGLPQELRLPSAPERPIVYRDEPDRPRPRIDRDREQGMALSVGRLRPGTPDDGRSWRFVCLAHNAQRGAAGAALLNAELALATGYPLGPVAAGAASPILDEREPART